MPSGVMNAPAVFQRLMQHVLSELQMGVDSFLLVYLNDVIIFSRSFEDHFEHLKMVINCLRRAGFMFKSVRGLHPNSRNLDSVRHFSHPTNLEQLR